VIGRTSPALALNLPTLAVALLALGLIVGGVGLFDDEGVFTRAGILLALGSMPPLIVWQSQRAHHATADQLEAAHEAGYRLALDHVARGLLEADATAPPDGDHRLEAPDDHTDDNRATGEQCKVRRLFAVGDTKTTSPTNHQEDTPQEKRTGT
jgi:hypothetical protein